jgi:hypothetical protein
MGDRTDKGENVKIWTSLIVAGAILALAVPSAFAARTAIPADPAVSVGPTYLMHAPTTQQLVALRTRKQADRIKVLLKKNKVLTAKNQKLAADNLAQLATIGNLNSQIWTLTHKDVVQPNPVNPDQDCIDYQLCTPEQDCKYWGNQCQYVTTTPATDAVREASSSEGGSQG